MNEDCPICTEKLENTERTIAQCGHMFHEDCLDEWREQPGRTCPMCRGVLSHRPRRRRSPIGSPRSIRRRSRSRSPRGSPRGSPRRGYRPRQQDLEESGWVGSGSEDERLALLETRAAQAVGTGRNSDAGDVLACLLLAGGSAVAINQCNQMGGKKSRKRKRNKKRKKSKKRRG